MGCGAAKEQVANPDQDNAVEYPVEDVDLPDVSTVTLPLEAFWSAGTTARNVAPHLVPLKGPFSQYEKVPPQSGEVPRFVFAECTVDKGDDAAVRSRIEIPRILPRKSSMKRLSKAIPQLFSEKVSLVPKEDSQGADNVMTAADRTEGKLDAYNGVLARVFLPHSFTGFSVGWVRIDFNGNHAVHNTAVHGKANCSNGRKYYLYPKAVGKIGIEVKVNGVKCCSDLAYPEGLSALPDVFFTFKPSSDLSIENSLALPLLIPLELLESYTLEEQNCWRIFQRGFREVMLQKVKAMNAEEAAFNCVFGVKFEYDNQNFVAWPELSSEAVGRRQTALYEYIDAERDAFMCSERIAEGSVSVCFPSQSAALGLLLDA